MSAERSGPKRWFFDAWSAFYDLPTVQAAVYKPMHDAVVVDARSTATVQEVHQVVVHLLCEVVDTVLTVPTYASLRAAGVQS